MMAVNSLKKTEQHSELAKHDVLKRNLPVYTIKWKCIETGEIFEDGASIIYVNTAHKDYTTAIGRLIHDFRCRKPENCTVRNLRKQQAAFTRTKEENI